MLSLWAVVMVLSADGAEVSGGVCCMQAAIKSMLNRYRNVCFIIFWLIHITNIY